MASKKDIVCSKDSAKRDGFKRKSYGNTTLKNPVSVASTCVKNFEKKLKTCPKGTFKRKAFDRKKYAGTKMCRPISVKGTCVKLPKPKPKPKSKTPKKCCPCKKKSTKK